MYQQEEPSPIQKQGPFAQGAQPSGAAQGAAGAPQAGASPTCSSIAQQPYAFAAALGARRPPAASG